MCSLHMNRNTDHPAQAHIKQREESPVEDDHLISEFKGLFLVMGDQDAGHANLVYDAFEPLPYRRTYLRSA